MSTKWIQLCMKYRWTIKWNLSFELPLLSEFLLPELHIKTCVRTCHLYTATDQHYSNYLLYECSNPSWHYHWKGKYQFIDLFISCYKDICTNYETQLKKKKNCLQFNLMYTTEGSPYTNDIKYATSRARKKPLFLSNYFFF